MSPETEAAKARQLIELIIWGSPDEGPCIWDNPHLNRLWLELDIETPEWTKDRMCGYAHAEWRKRQDARWVQDALPGMELHEMTEYMREVA